MRDQIFNIGEINAGTVVPGNHNDIVVVAGEKHIAADAGRAQPTFGIVTALPEEFVAVRVLLDQAGKPTTMAGDRAQYLLGTRPSRDENRPHKVVLTLLGDTGNTAAAESCANLIRSFPSVDTVVMCGIACGVPPHVCLGDIVAATWGIADYDHVDERDDGRRPRQPFPLPSPLLVRIARYLDAVELSGERPWEPWIDKALGSLTAFARPGPASDPHPAAPGSGRRPGFPKLHHGLIGSADRSLRSARVRDELAAAHRLIAIEMEGKGIGSAGFAGGLEWFVVRGISDYGDAATTRLWRRYASVVAAAYVRALLANCPPLSPRGGHPGASGGDRP
jgi:nucleoside phosphorylase